MTDEAPADTTRNRNRQCTVGMKFWGGRSPDGPPPVSGTGTSGRTRSSEFSRPRSRPRANHRHGCNLPNCPLDHPPGAQDRATSDNLRSIHNFLATAKATFPEPRGKLWTLTVADRGQLPVVRSSRPDAANWPFPASFQGTADRHVSTEQQFGNTKLFGGHRRWWYCLRKSGHLRLGVWSTPNRYRSGGIVRRRVQ